MAFNSREYSWADVSIFVDNILLTKGRGILYKRSKEKEAIYANGSEPLDIVSGNKAYEGTLDILLSQLLSLENLVGQDLLDIRFDMTVAYVPKTGQQVVVKTLKNCEFTDIEEGLKQGEKFKEVSLPFIFLKIKK